MVERGTVGSMTQSRLPNRRATRGQARRSLAARAAGGAGADRPPLRFRRRAPRRRVDRRALRRAGRRGPDRGRAGPRHLLVAARDRRRAGRPRRDRRRCAGAACSARCSARSARPGSPTTSRPASVACAGRCRQRTTYNVVCELAPADAERTMVVVAHHDAAHSGLIFHPALPKIADRLGLIEGADTSPPLMAPVIGGPILAALGALTGRRLLAKLGIFLGARLGGGDGRHRPAQDRSRRQRQRHRGRRPAGARPAPGRGAAARTCG